MSTQLNTSLLAGMIKAKRGSKGLRAAANEIGNVSSATLSRIEHGRIPDVDTFIKICKWLEVKSDTFILESNTNDASPKEKIFAHLKAEKELDQDTINMLIRVIDLAYNKSF